MLPQQKLLKANLKVFMVLPKGLLDQINSLLHL